MDRILRKLHKFTTKLVIKHGKKQRKRYGHGGRVHEIKITDTAEITIAGTNPNPEP